MGCSIEDQRLGYNQVNSRLRKLNPKVDEVTIQNAINEYWLGLENNMMTPAEKAVYRAVVEKTDGVARINLGGLNQLNEPIVVIKDIGKEYVVHLLSGKNYTFKKGSIRSNETAKKQAVVMPSMIYTTEYKETEFDKWLKNGMAPMKLRIRHSPLRRGPTYNTPEQSIKKYQEELIRWTKEKTGVKIIANDELLNISKVMLEGSVEIARYTIAPNTISFIENLPDLLEKSFRSQIYKAYLVKNKLSKSELDLKLKEKIDKELQVDMGVKGILELIPNPDETATLAHEIIHAGALAYMSNPANKDSVAMKRMEDLFDLALKNIDIIDNAMVKNEQINQYWTTDIHEFVAEGLSNPQFINTLMQITVEGKNKLSTIFKEFISTLLDMIGIKESKKDNLHEYLLDAYAYVVEQKVGDSFDHGISLRNVGKHLDKLDAQEKVMGSDAEVGIGSKVTDEFIGQEQLNLGQVLKEEFNNYYAGDVAAGNEIQTQEFNDLQDTILDTYEKTMQDLGKGKVGLRLFESTVDQTAGQIDLRSKEIHVRWNKMSRLSRVSEVFLHEVNHLMSSHVFKNNGKLRTLMENLRDSAVDSGVTYKIFLEGIENPTPNEIAIAKMKFEYVFDKTANPEEFYAYATTNEQVYNAIKNVKITTPLIKQLAMDPNKKEPLKKVLNKLIEIVNDQWRMLTGRGVLGGVMIKEMLLTIAKIDAEVTLSKRKKTEAPEGITDYAKNKINQLDAVLEPVVAQVDKWNEKFSAKQSAKWLANHIKRVPLLNDLVETGISQYLWRMVTQDTTTTDVADMYMVFRHAKHKVEKHTADIRNGVKKVVGDLYEKEDEATKKAVNNIVLEGDLAQFSAAELKEYLTDSKKIDADVEQMQIELGADETTLKQIDGLVEYLLTGATTVHNQQINANNIVTKLYKPRYSMKQIKKIKALLKIHAADSVEMLEALNKKGEKPKNANKDLVKLVDRLVSLKVLQKSDKKQIELLSELDEETLDKTIHLYRGYIDNMRANATLGAYDPIPKGYTRPEDGLVKYELIPEEEVKAQQSVMMHLAETKEYVVVEGKKYFLMTGRTKSTGFTEGAIGLISHTTEGIPISSLIRKNNELAGKVGLIDGELRRRTKQIIDAINDNDATVLKQFKLGAGQALVPVYDHQYNIVDYRIQLTKLEKEIHLPDRKTELSELMSHTFSRSIKTSLTATQNKRVVDTIIENSAKGILERPDEYLLIEEYTEEDKMNGVKREKRHDRWDYLPDHTKDYIYQKLNNKSIYIHKDFVELMTGEKDVTIGNFAKFGVELKKYPVAKARLMALESYLAEILGYVKHAMVVLNADVLLGNQTSNAIVAITHGIDPVTYTRKFKERWDQLNDYNTKAQQLAELEVKRMAGENVDNRMKQLKRQLEGNVWDELVKDGQYTALVEDINIDDQGGGQLLTMVNDYVNKKNWGGAVKTLRNMLYIDRTSALYGTMLKTVHYGDAITRQIIKEELEKKLRDRWIDKLKPNFELLDMNKLKKVVAANEVIAQLKELIKANPKLTKELEKDIQDINNYLDQLLVNYGYTMNRWWKYAERVGGLFFMKYYLSQAKAIMSMTRRNPVMTALTQGTQRLAGLDFQDPIDTYLRSGIDGVAYRWMADDAPGQLLQPNIWDLIPDISSIVRMN